MKKAVVYAWQGKLFVRACSQTLSGLWIDDGPCFKMATAVLVEELGKVILGALELSRLDIPHPTSWKHLNDPLLEAAGIRSWDRFGRLSKGVCVELTDQFYIKPTRNLGARGGLIVIEGRVVKLSAAANVSEIGEGVLAAVAAAE